MDDMDDTATVVPDQIESFHTTRMSQKNNGVDSQSRAVLCAAKS